MTRRGNNRFVRGCLLAAAATLAGAAPAAANVAAPPRPAQIGGPAAGGRTPLAVREAALSIDCSAGGHTCELQVSYLIHNPSAETSGGTAAFYSLYTGNVDIRVDDRPAGQPIDPAAAAGFDARVAEVAGDRWTTTWARDDQGLGRHGFELSLAPGASARVQITGVVAAHLLISYDWAVTAARARHVLFPPSRDRPRRLVIDYLVAPIRTWGAFPQQMAFTLKAPARWAVDIIGARTTETRTGAIEEHRGTIATSESRLHIGLWIPPGPRVHRGFLLGIGGHVDDATGLRLRGGVEVGFLHHWLASLAIELETAGANGVVLVPALAVGSPWVLIIPSVSVGVGLPVRVAPDTDAGVRVQVDAHLGPVGLFTAFDYYPWMSADPRRFEVAMMAQLSL